MNYPKQRSVIAKVSQQQHQIAFNNNNNNNQAPEFHKASTSEIKDVTTNNEK
jgi:hypothetical protein